MEFHGRIFLLGHLNSKSRIGKKDQLAFFIFSKIALLYSFELFKFLIVGIIRRYPASLVNIDVFIRTLGPIFVLKSLLNYFKLKRAYGSNHLSVIQIKREQLRHSFIHKLVKALKQLFCFHRIRIVYIPEMLR